MNIQEHKPPLLSDYKPICNAFTFMYNGNKYFVCLKRFRQSKNTIYAVVSDKIVNLGQYKISGIQGIPVSTAKLEVLAYSVFAHYLYMECY